MNSRHRPVKNSIRLGTIFRWVTVVTLIGGVASCYVYLRNLDLKRSNEIRQLESQIGLVLAEVELYETRIEKAKSDREGMRLRLEIQNSQLIEIEAPAAVIVRGTEPSQEERNRAIQMAGL